MSTAQVDRLQALLSRVQVNRSKPRPAVSAAASSRNGAPMRAPDPHLTQPIHTMSAIPAPTHVFETAQVQDSIDTTPPPAALPQPQPQQHARPTAEPARRAVAEERVRVPDMKPAAPPAKLPPQPERPMPAPARPTAPGATPLEMALEGEVARAAESAAAVPQPAARPAPAPAQEPFMTRQDSRQDPRQDPRQDSRQDSRHEAVESGGRVLADPTPPQPTRPIVQAVTKHPPNQPHTFSELLKRSLALRPR
jgi:hypothetical protein